MCIQFIKVGLVAGADETSNFDHHFMLLCEFMEDSGYFETSHTL